MSRPNTIVSESHVPGHDRPWVYFMIDAFFLVTQFFVITFHVRQDEVVLPQKLPPAGPICPTRKHIDSLGVHVLRATPAASPSYLIKTGGVSQAHSATEFLELLAETAQTSNALRVEVSYDEGVEFGDVMPVFNACSKFKIADCGLLRQR